MKIELDKLACSGLENQRGGLVAGLHAALFHYTGRLKTGRRPLSYPRFLADQPAKAPHLVVEVEVDPEIEASLEREAAASQVTVNQIVGHSVLIYLADTELVANSV